MKILFATSEAAPFFKTGGLGDVAFALPKELASKGHEVAVFLPKAKQIPKAYADKLEYIGYDYVNVGWRRQYIGIFRLIQDNITYYFVDNEYYFNRDTLYGYFDDGERWAYFSLSIIKLMETVNFIPDILHVNDFHTSIIPFLLKEKFYWISDFSEIKTVLTIHNIAFQGAMDPKVLSELFGLDMYHYYNGTVRLDNAFNFLKTGILYADKVTTVSPSYAKEIQTANFGYGLDGILRDVNYKLSGILNGIDTEIFNPKTDPLLEHHFWSRNLKGKALNKMALQEQLGLSVNEQIPMVGMVSRLTRQKGFDLVLADFESLLQLEVQFVVIGTGDPDLAEGFEYFANKYPDKVAAIIDFDIQLAQKIYAASDFFLMPSAFEPCGLSQMIAMRYGTLPIVHETGGLIDTVEPYNPIEQTGNGFGFVDFSIETLDNTVRQAISLYWDNPKVFKKLRQNALKTDFSWHDKADQYISLYQSI